MSYSSTSPSPRRAMKSLAWSNTRITVLERCERKYYFSYYTFALKQEYPEIWQEALVLKGLKSIEMWIGEKSHYLLSDYLHLFKSWVAIEKDGEEVSDTVRVQAIEELKEKIKAEMESEFQFSKERDYRDYQDFFGKFGLSEHFYGEEVDAKLPSAIEKVCANLDRFIASNWHSKVQDYFETAKSVYVESPRIPDFEAMKVQVSKIPALRNVSVMAAPDFGVVFSDTDYVILDRKSGKEDVLQEGISDQIKVYALKMLLKKGYANLNGVRIEGQEVYLNTMNNYGGVLMQDDIDGIVTKIEKDVGLQKKFLVDEDPVRNIPVDAMMFTKTSSVKKCESCTFRSVCEKFKV